MVPAESEDHVLILGGRHKEKYEERIPKPHP